MILLSFLFRTEVECGETKRECLDRLKASHLTSRTILRTASGRAFCITRTPSTFNQCLHSSGVVIRCAERRLRKSTRRRATFGPFSFCSVTPRSTVPSYFSASTWPTG